MGSRIAELVSGHSAARRGDLLGFDRAQRELAVTECIVGGTILTSVMDCPTTASVSPQGRDAERSCCLAAEEVGPSGEFR